MRSGARAKRVDPMVALRYEWEWLQVECRNEVKIPTFATQRSGTRRKNVKDPTRDDGVWGTPDPTAEKSFGAP